jgi:hypothetical protein
MMREEERREQRHWMALLSFWSAFTPPLRHGKGMLPQANWSRTEALFQQHQAHCGRPHVA